MAAGGGFAPEARFYVYLPNGTYLVNEPIFYRGDTVTKTVHEWDICHVKFVGQSRAKTILRLADHAPAFQDPAHPNPLLAFQHPTTTFNNGPGDNYLRNLTINVGSGNPGAVGVFMQGANQTDMHNLSIVSEDGAGRYGVWFKQGSVQGYYADITVKGFDYGLYDTVNPENSAAFEYLTMQGQRVAGIYHSGGSLSLRRFLSDQSASGVTALQIAGNGPQAVIVDSALDGGKPANPAISVAQGDKESLFARHVATSGYGSAIVRGGDIAAPAGTVKEYVSTPAKTLFDGPATSLDLPVLDTPPTPWYDPARDWAIVDDYPSVQDALNSGKPVVVFKKRRYKLTGDVVVPPSVKVVNCMGANVDGGVLVVDQPSTEPLAVIDLGPGVRVDAQRDLVKRCGGGNVSNPKGLPVTFYLENVNDCASGDQFCPPGARVYARCIDVEYRNVPQIVCNGGALWVFGFKTEDTGTAAPFLVKNGGKLEVLGGYVNMLSGIAKPDHGQPPIVTNLDSSVSVSCSTNMVGLFSVGASETRSGVTHQAAHTDFPSRGSEYGSNYVIGLYIGTKDGGGSAH